MTSTSGLFYSMIDVFHTVCTVMQMYSVRLCMCEFVDVVSQHSKHYMINILSFTVFYLFIQLSWT